MIIQTVVVVCEYCADTVHGYSGEPVEVVRSRAAAGGWSTARPARSSSGIDVCRACVAAGQPDAAEIRRRTRRSGGDR